MKRIASVLLMVLAASLLSLPAQGSIETEQYPVAGKTVTLIVPYSAGGGTDTMARMLMPFLDKEMGTSSVVVNKPGAAAETGMAEMNRAKPDGYNLGLISSPDNFSLATYRESVSFDNDKFIYLAAFTDTPTVLVAKKGSPFNKLSEFVAYAKANPGKLVVAESGDSHTLTTALLEEAAGIKLTNVNYAGGGDNFNAVLGGHVDAGVMALLFAQRAIDQGCVILGVASSQRVPSFPAIPTFTEQGFKVVMTSSRIITVPVGTPESVVARLRAAFDVVGKNESLITAVNKSGEVYSYKSGKALDDYIKAVKSDTVRICTESKGKFIR